MPNNELAPCIHEPCFVSNGTNPSSWEAAASNIRSESFASSSIGAPTPGPSASYREQQLGNAVLTFARYVSQSSLSVTIKTCLFVCLPSFKHTYVFISQMRK